MWVEFTVRDRYSQSYGKYQRNGRFYLYLQEFFFPGTFFFYNLTLLYWNAYESVFLKFNCFFEILLYVSNDIHVERKLQFENIKTVAMQSFLLIIYIKIVLLVRKPFLWPELVAIHRVLWVRVVFPQPREDFLVLYQVSTK